MEKNDKRCAILRAILELVAEQGFHGTPMALVAERAGVAAGTIYRYFESKDDIINEAYGYLEARFLQTLMEDYPAEAPVRERFLHIGRVVLRYCVEFPLEFRFLEQFHNSPYGIEHRREKFFGTGDKDVITKLFTEAKQAQIVKELPLPVLFALTFSPLLDIARDHILGFVQMDETLASAAVEACWDAVRR